MPKTSGLLSWPAFHDRHASAYLVFADLEEPRRRQPRFAMLASLAKAMNLQGAFALSPDEQVIRVAFERADDALKFAQGVGARKTAREGGWAGQWWFTFDEETEAAIKAALPHPPKRSRSAP